MAFRGIDLLDWYRGRLPIRRLRILIDHLPPESATKTAIRNAITPEQAEVSRGESHPEKAPWSNLEMLVAAMRDEMRLNTIVAIAAAGGKPPTFEPTPRPGITPTSGGRKRLTDEQRRVIDPRLRDQPKEA